MLRVSLRQRGKISFLDLFPAANRPLRGLYTSLLSRINRAVSVDIQMSAMLFPTHKVVYSGKQIGLHRTIYRCTEHCQQVTDKPLHEQFVFYAMTTSFLKYSFAVTSAMNNEAATVVEQIIILRNVICESGPTL